MPNKRGPFFVQLNYHSPYAPHSAQIQTNTWSNVSSTNGKGQFTTWNGDGEDAQDAIEGLVTLLLPFYNAEVEFDNWIIFEVPDGSDSAVPRVGNTFSGMVGSNSASGQRKANQVTLTWRTESFGLAKLVLLDSTPDLGYNKITALPSSGRLFDLDHELTSMDAEWAGRDNSRAETFISYAQTLNEKLRREYRMT